VGVNRFNTMTNDLLVFDAERLEDGPMATVHLPIHDVGREDLIEVRFADRAQRQELTTAGIGEQDIRPTLCPGDRLEQPGRDRPDP
jgi:hypothetical protein